MTSFSDLRARLDLQFFDPQHLTLPVSSQEEATRTALEQLNSFLGKLYTLEGLDGALSTTLPEALLPVLLYGMAACALDFCLRGHLTSFKHMLESRETLRLWCDHLRRQFDLGLERARFLMLQTEGVSPYGSWEWHEPAGWQADQAQ